MSFVIHISAVITNGSKVLIVKEGKPHVYGFYNFPGGHLERNENILSGIYREIKEETGLDVKIDYLIDILVTHSETTFINFIFHADYIKGEPVAPENEILECRWIEINDLINGFDGELLNKRIR